MYNKFYNNNKTQPTTSFTTTTKHITVYIIFIDKWKTAVTMYTVRMLLDSFPFYSGYTNQGPVRIGAPSDSIVESVDRPETPLMLIIALIYKHKHQEVCKPPILK